MLTNVKLTLMTKFQIPPKSINTNIQTYFQVLPYDYIRFLSRKASYVVFIPIWTSFKTNQVLITPNKQIEQFSHKILKYTPYCKTTLLTKLTFFMSSTLSNLYHFQVRGVSINAI